MTRYLREWEKIRGGHSNGWYATTPFFLSFVDAPARLRRAQWLYLTALCEDYMGNDETANAKMQESAALNADNLYAVGFAKQGFLE